MKRIFTLLFLAVANLAIAATGTLRGTVIDDSNGETIIGAYVIVEGTSNGTSTDIDGNYTIKLEEGTYSIKFSSIGYTDKVISEVNIKAGEVTIINTRLSDQAEQVDVVVVTAKRNTRSEAALMTIQKKSSNVIDGVSSEAFKKTGDATAAAAIKRVTGVSVEGGKYVYVRGLGDRYTKTILNGMTIPGLDPDKNTVQMDLFPSNLIDRIVVYKSFTPNLPGDFTGGMVDVTTKDFPARKTLDISLGYSYTTGMNFNRNFVLSKQTAANWFGFAGNKSKLHFNPNTQIPDESQSDPLLNKLSKGFDKELGVDKGVPTFLNQSYAVSYGDQFEKNERKFGFNFAFNYSNQFKYYDDVYRGIFFKNDNEDVYTFDKREVSTGQLGQNETLWSGLLGGAFKFKNHKISLSVLHSQNGVRKAADYISRNFESTQATLYKDAIEYSQKSVSNLLLKGKHAFAEDKFEFGWKLSPTYSNITEPDVRSTKLSLKNGRFELQQGDGAAIDRFFRTLNEINFASAFDLTYNFKQWSDEKAKLKFGLANTFKTRDYSILHYTFEATSAAISNTSIFTEDPNTILQDKNIWTADSRYGMYVKGNKEPDNEYSSMMNIAGAYAMAELPLTKQLKSIFGLRVENAIINYDGYYKKPIDSMVYNAFAFLPSLNLVYRLKENMNLRASYSRTVARPSFKEKSTAHITDPISQTVFIGNLNLVETDVDNVDLRWEYFFNRGEMVSVSGFFKNFTNPIEVVRYEKSPDNIKPRNIGGAMVFGGELEFKKNFGFINDKWKGLSVGANFTYIHSMVNMKEVITEDEDGSGNAVQTEFALREKYARTGEKISTFRTMQGQAPFIVNSFINYSADSLGIEANLSYNVQGKRLAIIGSGIVPDVYEDPFHSLNFKFSYKFGKKDQMKLSFSAKNLIGDNFYQFYDSYKAPEAATYSSYSKGRSFSLGFSYKIF